MKNLLDPKWLLLANTLPIVMLFALFLGQYNIIRTLLDEDNIRLWGIFGAVLGVLGLLNFLYAIYLIIRKQHVSIWYGVIALVCYISFIYIYYYQSEEIIPFDVPRWMLSDNIFLYVGTFLMPTLIYSLFVLVARLTPRAETYKAGISFAIAIGIPIMAYLFSQIILPLWYRFDIEFNEHVLLILIIVVTLVFLFFLLRTIYIVASKKSAGWQKYQLIWKIPIVIVFPLLGLLLNNGNFSNDFGDDSGILGNFNNYWFYILAVANGILLCLPNLEKKHTGCFCL